MKISGPSPRLQVASAAPPPVETTLRADDAGKLELNPGKPGPIQVSHGEDGRYHVKTSDQDIAFTAEQMGRLNIKADPAQVSVGKDVDLPFRVDGKLAGAGKAAGKGFQSLPEIAGDAFVRSSKSEDVAFAAPVTPGSPLAPLKDAGRAVAGTGNWDSVGVPSTAQLEKARAAMDFKADPAFTVPKDLMNKSNWEALYQQQMDKQMHMLRNMIPRVSGSLES